MWIRSQDKKSLVDAHEIKVFDDICNEDSFVFVICSDNAVTLGVYSSEERALEVLDDIQKQITTCVSLSEPHGDAIFSNRTVYQMTAE